MRVEIRHLQKHFTPARDASLLKVKTEVTTQREFSRRDAGLKPNL
jgi:hypothetical protein